MPVSFEWSVPRWAHGPGSRPGAPATTGIPRAVAPAPGATPLAQRLQVAFRRNQARTIDQVLAHLPPWPLSAQVRAAAHTLLALKWSVYRAQAEGVPAPMVQRYLDHTVQAADALWQIASKLDPLGQQEVTYAVVAPQLVQAETHVAQFQQAAHATQEAIALLIVSGMQSDALQHADEDLSALTHAIRQVTAGTTVLTAVR